MVGDCGGVIFLRFFPFKFGFGLVLFSCIPSFNLLLCLEQLVKKFSVVGGWMKATVLVLVQTLIDFALT